jgi:hypothetical protein
MSASQPSTAAMRTEATPAQPSTDQGWRRRHEEAVVQAEVRRLARALAPYGVLHHDTLESFAGARHWHASGFDDALSAAVRAGAIRRLGCGYYRCEPR